MLFTWHFREAKNMPKYQNWYLRMAAVIISTVLCASEDYHNLLVLNILSTRCTVCLHSVELYKNNNVQYNLTVRMSSSSGLLIRDLNKNLHPDFNKQKLTWIKNIYLYICCFSFITLHKAMLHMSSVLIMVHNIGRWRGGTREYRPPGLMEYPSGIRSLGSCAELWLMSRHA